MHHFSATIWRRCLCLPSILYRLNSLLVAEELRREIAQSTGVGLPWTSDQYKFEKLSFLWDASKEMEISDMPDVEVDMATIQQQNEVVTIKNEAESGCDPKWNFEISEWDETCLKESGAANFTNKLLETLSSNQERPASSKGGTGWLIDEEIGGSSSNPKTLFIDPNDMDFFADDFVDSDEENEKFDKIQQTKKTQNPAKSNSFAPPNVEAYNSNEDEFDDENNDDDFYEENQSEKKHRKSEDQKLLKFTIDMNTLKADMKKKSAKLISKLSVSSNNCYLVKSLVKAESTCTVNEFDEPLDESKSDFVNFDLTNVLASNLQDFKKNESIDFLTCRGRNTWSLAKNKSSNFESSIFDNDLELNDWFPSIEFKFDTNKKNESILVVEEIKNKFKLKNEVNIFSKQITEHGYFKQVYFERKQLKKMIIIIFVRMVF